MKSEKLKFELRLATHENRDGCRRSEALCVCEDMMVASLIKMALEQHILQQQTIICRDDQINFTANIDITIIPAKETEQ